MKLLIHSHSFWPAIGGVETYARALGEGLSRDHDIETTLVTDTAYGGPSPNWHFSLIRAPGWRGLWSLIRASDVVFVAGPALLPMALAILARRPFVVEHHGYQAVCPNGLLLHKPTSEICSEAFRRRRYNQCRRCVQADRGVARAPIQVLLTLFRRWMCRRAYAHVAVSEHVQKRHGFVNMQVIYHGVAEPPPSGIVAKESKQEVHFGYVGRLVEEKGLPLLIQAAAELKARGHRCRLRLVGDGPLRKSLEAQASRSLIASEVEITGFLEGPAFAQAVAGLDVVVMPSVWEESAGLAAMEQMMRGGVVLAADIGGLGEIVGDGGLKFRPLDAQDLAAKMMALADPKLRQSLGAAARQRASRLFGLERMIEGHRDLLRRAGQDAR